MPFAILSKFDHLLVTIHGEWTAEEARKALTEASLLVQSRGINKVLLDVSNGSVKWATLDLLQLTSLMTRTFPVGTRHALVAAPLGSLSRGARFAENLASNAGVSLRYFFNIRMARKWLLFESQPV